MAKAPIPGVSARAAASDAAKRTMTITLEGQPPVVVTPGNVPFGERLAVRKATGIPYEAFLGGEDKIGLDSVQVLWWLGRRASGEPGLTFDAALAEWPDLTTEDSLTVQIDEPGDDPSPEA